MNKKTKNILPLTELNAAYEPTADIAQYVIRSDMTNFAYELLENYIGILCLNNKSSRVMTFAVGYDIFSSLEQYRIDSDMARVFVTDIRRFIVDSIDKGFYISFIADMYYIENYKECYKTNHGVRELLIYGYDLVENVFYASDYFDFTNRTFETIKISQIEDSFNLSKAGFYEKPINRELDYYIYLNKIHLLKLDHTKKRELKIEKVVSEIDRFISGYKFYSCDEIFFGITFFDVLFERLENNEISTKNFYLIKAHIMLMIERIEMIFKMYSIKNTEILNSLDSLNTESGTLWKLIAKYMMNRDAGLKSKCKEMTIRIKDKYYAELVKILNIMKIQCS